MSTLEQLGAPQGERPEDLQDADHAWAEIQESAEFQGLKHTLRRFIFPATLGFLAWYLLYVLMTVYARGFMSHEVLGNINVAYVFGLLQFISTFVIAFFYSRYAEKHFDPVADRIRHRVQGALR